MKPVTVDDAVVAIKNYLASDLVTPYLVVVDDCAEYKGLISRLGVLREIRLSHYCAVEDAFPDLGKLYGDLATVTHNTLLLGLGENIYMSGRASTLGRLVDTLTGAKVVALCRGIRDRVRELGAEDAKFRGLRRVCFLRPGTLYHITKVDSSIPLPAISGFRALLTQLENGSSHSLIVKTSLPLSNVRHINSAHDALLYSEPTFSAPAQCLTDEQWLCYLGDRSVAHYGLFHWRTFLGFKVEPPKDVYLKYVVDTSENSEIYKERVLTALLDFDVEDPVFPEMYDHRKLLLANLRDVEVAEYIVEAKIRDDDRMSYLTDNTSIERQTIIQCICDLGNIPDALDKIYPELSDYLHDYDLGGYNGQLLTDYFREYKRLKVTNRVTSEFLGKVREYGTDGNRLYNSLPTRGEVLDSVDKDNVALFWIDALGVEYMGFIQKRSQALGLRIKTHTVRANLPTLTSYNKDFFDEWKGLKIEIKDLDRVKHDGERDYNYERTRYPIHLAEELRIIGEVLDKIKVQLASRAVGKVLIVSDHGASRLAVISEQESMWEMLERGKNSGRCCLCSEADVKSEYATRENGYWVLANYDRFRGSRKASVEVHGGATLEEVVIPLIELELYDQRIEVTLVDSRIIANYRKSAELVLFSKDNLRNVSLQVKDKRYFAQGIGNNKYKIAMPDIKASGNYAGDVFEGDNLVARIEFEVQSGSVQDNDSDWF